MAPVPQPCVQLSIAREAGESWMGCGLAVIGEKCRWLGANETCFHATRGGKFGTQFLVFEDAGN